jgi:hypothetical protein
MAKLRNNSQENTSQISLVVMLAAAIASFFLAAHHARPAALGAEKFPLFMGHMGLFPHLDLALPTEHEVLPLT